MVLELDPWPSGGHCYHHNDAPVIQSTANEKFHTPLCGLKP